MSTLGRIAIWVTGVALLAGSSLANADETSTPAETRLANDAPLSTASTSNDATSAPPAPQPSLAPESLSPDALRTNEVRDVRSEIPNYAYAYTAYGAAAKTLGVEAYGLGVAAAGQQGIVGGGLMVWGSPIDRLTLIGDGQRDVYGNFAPSGGIVVRVLGKNGDGWSLGGLGKFKVEGFGDGKPTGAGTPPAKPGEIESEVEFGALISYAKSGGVHLDLNAITGMGTGDDGEVDAEGRLRFGYDLTHILRVGFDGQTRVRLNGPRYLPNGRIWDFAAGPQAILGSKNFFGALTGGPATMGLLSDRVGWNVIASIGGTTL